MKSRPTKNLLRLLSAFLLVCAYAAIPAAAEKDAPVAVPARQFLVIDGEERHGMEIYNINDETYYRLRDMAMLLAGTKAEFGVAYDDAARCISVTRGAEYLPVGGELAAGTDRSAGCVPSNQTLRIDGAETALTAYNLGGTNFFRLRDLGPVLGFEVDYDALRNAATVDTHSVLNRIRLGTSEYFLTLPADVSPRETGGYAFGSSGMTLDVFETHGVSDLRSLAEAEAAEAASAPENSPAVEAAPVPGDDALCYISGSELVCYLDAGDGLCEKLVFALNGGGSEAALDILRTLEKPVRVPLGGGPLSLYLPETFTERGETGSGAYADEQSKRYIDIYFDSGAGDFDVYVSALGKAWGKEGAVPQSPSLIMKYYVIDSVPASLSAHGARCCMPCAIKLGDGAATAVFWADNANFGWARRILRSLSAA